MTADAPAWFEVNSFARPDRDCARSWDVLPTALPDAASQYARPTIGNPSRWAPEVYFTEYDSNS